MVASKTSILVAAVALGAASVYAAPAPLTKDITLSRRQADDSALIARDFDDDELYAREFFDELDARDFEDDLEARDFDEDELFARELYEDELEARALEDDDEFEDHPFKPSPTTPSSTATPSSTSTPSASTPSSKGVDVKSKPVLAATSPSALNSGKKVHHKHNRNHRHRICKTYKKAYEMLTGEKLSEHKVGEHKVGEHDLHAQDAHHTQDVHAKDHHDQDRHHLEHRPKPKKHGNKRHHRPTAEEIAAECGPEIARLLAAHRHHQLDAAINVSGVHSTALRVQTPEVLKVQTPEAPKVQTLETLKVQTPTKAKRGLNELWARVVGGKSGEMQSMVMKSGGQGYPDAAGNAEGSPSPPLPEGGENLAAAPGPEGQQGPGQHKHRHRHQRHRHRNCHQHPHSRHCRSHRKRPHHRKHKQDLAGGATLDSTKGAAAEPNGPVSDGAPAAPAEAPVTRRSLEDELWERGLANSLGLDEDYFTKRFFDEEDLEF